MKYKVQFHIVSVDEIKSIKVQFHIVSVDEIKSMQQKLNTWLTTGHMKKFETFVLPDGRIMFQCLVLKSEE